MSLYVTPIENIKTDNDKFNCCLLSFLTKGNNNKQKATGYPFAKGSLRIILNSEFTLPYYGKVMR